MTQQELWAAPDEFSRLTIALDAKALVGPDVYDLVITTHGRKTSGPVWSSSQALEGRLAIFVATQIAGFVLGRVDTTMWRSEPPTRPQEWWEKQWTEF